MAESEEDLFGLEGLAAKKEAVSSLINLRRERAALRDELIRQAVACLLHPVPVDAPQPSLGAELVATQEAEPVATQRVEPMTTQGAESLLPRPLSCLAGLAADVVWQRVAGRHWIVAVDVTNGTCCEVPSPTLLASSTQHEPLVYECRIASVPFVLDEKLQHSPVNVIVPGRSVRVIANVELPESASRSEWRISLALTSPPGHAHLETDVGFYQLTVGDVSIGPQQLLAGEHGLFQDIDVSAEDVQACWALSERSLCLQLRPGPGEPLSVPTVQDKLTAAGDFQQAPGDVLTVSAAGHRLFASLLLLKEDAEDGHVAATVWVKESAQLPLLLYRLRQLLPSCQLLNAAGSASAADLRAALVDQLEFVESRLGGTSSTGSERRALRLGDTQIPVAEYVGWRRQLQELEDATTACVLRLVEPRLDES